MTKQPVQHTPEVILEFVEGARKLRAEAAATVDEKERAHLERRAQHLDDMLAFRIDCFPTSTTWLNAFFGTREAPRPRVDVDDGRGGVMPGDSLTDRVERLEKTVDGLQTLPAEVAALGERVGLVEVQVSELRTEMREEFSAVRRDGRAQRMQAEFAAVRSEMQTGFTNVKTELREEIRVETTSVRTEMQKASPPLVMRCWSGLRT